MATGLSYFGKKTEKNLQQTLQVFPEMEMKKIVDCCFGSGSFTRTIACEKAGIERTAFELEPSLFKLHEVIKSEKSLQMLKAAMKKVPNTKEYYMKCEDTVLEFNKKKSCLDDISIALAELYLIYFSMNSARNSRRNTESYKKERDLYKRNTKRIELNAIVERFFMRVPALLEDLHANWQKVDIRNESFVQNMHLWEDENTFVYADVPYMLDKRGRGKKDNPKSKAGYLMDWSFEDHVNFIDKVIKMKEEGKLKSKVMICSNFEIDNEGYLVDIANDPYTKLLKNGFHLVVIERKYTCAPSQDKGEDKKKTKKKKVEVVYVNYGDIVGSWHNFEHFDYEDLISGNVKVRKEK